MNRLTGMKIDSVTAKCFHDLRAAVGAWTLGLVDPGRLPDLATVCLARSIDTPALRLLAGVTSGDDVATGPLWEQALREMGLAVPDKHSAATAYAACVARLIVSGEIGPYEGAKEICHAAIAVDDESFHELDPFIYASSEHEERPADRPHFERVILEEAKRWSVPPR